jgi:hypothetical protein
MFNNVISCIHTNSINIEIKFSKNRVRILVFNFESNNLLKLEIKDRIRSMKEVWTSNLDSSSVCMQHSLLVTSVISGLMTVIGALFGAYKWFHWIPLVTAIIVMLVAIPAAYHLRPKLLIWFAIIDGSDFILKVFNIGSLIYYKVKINEDCSPFDMAGSEEECPNTNWRILLLNITNAIVFYIFAAIIEIILFTFSIYLIYSVRKYKPYYIDNSFIESKSLEESKDMSNSVA